MFCLGCKRDAFPTKETLDVWRGDGTKEGWEKVDAQEGRHWSLVIKTPVRTGRGIKGSPQENDGEK